MAIERYPTVSGSTYWATLTSGSAHTKGSYVELTASTSEALRGIYLVIVQGSASSAGYLVDIATGASSSETVVVADVPFGSPTGNVPGNQVGVFIPVNIASGTRIAARCQCSTGSATVLVAVFGVGGTGTAVSTTYGAVSANSAGTTIDPGAVANTKGSYAELTTATTADIDWLITVVSSGNSNPTQGAWAIDIATGAGGAESVVIPDVALAWTGFTQDNYGPISNGFPVSIASGTRIAARAQSSVTDATDRTIPLLVLGITNSGMNGGGGGGGTGGAFTFVG